MFKSNNQSKSGITNFLLRVLYFSRNSQAGSTLAVGVGLGLIVLGATAMALANAGKEKTNTTSNEMTKQAMAVAETGVSRLQNLFVAEPRLAMASSHTEWATLANLPPKGTATPTTADTTLKNIVDNALISNSNSSSCVGIITSQPPLTSQKAEAVVTALKGGVVNVSGTGDTWVNLGGEKGKYKLVSYQRARGDNSKGILTIQGQVGNSNSSKAQIQVAFDANVSTTNNPSQPGTGFPGLWAKDFKATTNVNYQSNVYDSSKSVAGAIPANCTNVKAVPSNPLTLGSGVSANPGPKSNNGNRDLYVLNSTQGKVQLAGDFPPLPNNNVWPSGPTVPNTFNSINCNNLSSSYPRTNDYDSTGKRFGATTNAPAENATYVYKCTGGFTGPNQNLTLGAAANNGQETLKFYVNGSLTIGSNNNVIAYRGTNKNTRSIFYVKDAVTVNSNGSIGDIRNPSAFQVYSYKVEARTVNTFSGNEKPTLEMKGNGSFYGFLFAPFANLSTNGTIDTSGAIWVKSIEMVGNGKIWQGIFDVTLLDDGQITLPTTKYTIGSISNWSRTQAN